MKKIIRRRRVAVPQSLCHPALQTYDILEALFDIFNPSSAEDRAACANAANPPLDSPVSALFRHLQVHTSLQWHGFNRVPTVIQASGYQIGHVQPRSPISEYPLVSELTLSARIGGDVNRRLLQNVLKPVRKRWTYWDVTFRCIICIGSRV